MIPLNIYIYIYKFTNLEFAADCVNDNCAYQPLQFHFYYTSLLTFDRQFTQFLINFNYLSNSTANKYYSSVGQHEKKNEKTTGQIKFSAVTIKQQIKLVLQHSLCK